MDTEGAALVRRQRLFEARRLLEEIRYIRFAVRVSNVFRRSRKYDFRLLLSGFLTVTPPNEVKFVSKVDQ